MMLVLSRRQDESLWIGNDVEIVVLRISHNRVRLGVRAPLDVPVRRGELAPFGWESLTQSGLPMDVETDSARPR